MPGFKKLLNKQQVYEIVIANIDINQRSFMETDLEEKKKHGSHHLAQISDSYLFMYIIGGYIQGTGLVHSRYYSAFHALECACKAYCLSAHLEFKMNHDVNSMLATIGKQNKKIKNLLPQVQSVQKHDEFYKLGLENYDLSLIMGEDHEDIEIYHLIKFNKDLKYKIERDFTLTHPVTKSMTFLNVKYCTLMGELRKAYMEVDRLNLDLIANLQKSLNNEDTDKIKYYLRV